MSGVAGSSRLHVNEYSTEYSANYCTRKEDSLKGLENYMTYSPPKAHPADWNVTRRRLVVLDLNGILCRISRVNNLRTDFEKYNVKEDWKNQTLALKVRPDLCKFLSLLLDTCDIGIWTSRKAYNFEQLWAALYDLNCVPDRWTWEGHRGKADLIPFSRNPFKLTQENCVPISLGGNDILWTKPVMELRDLWPGSERDILFVDDSVEKMTLNHPYQAIYPPKWEVNMTNDRFLLGALYPFIKKWVESKDPVYTFVEKNRKMVQSKDHIPELARFWRKQKVPYSDYLFRDCLHPEKPVFLRWFDEETTKQKTAAF
ncbi:hypothetical protein R1sor_012910 [Riccia sorocarpa]|uniref:Mitochondrial import inner membrane translocase subunit TIM50 n=1 Tax=Riccia sorocarpa TaxID=122646 RepID=A0ABD3I8I3_9MARC